MFGPTNRDAVQRNAKDITASANTDAVITIVADARNYHVIDSVHCSYKLGSGTTGKLTIAIGGTTVHETDITTNGVYEYLFAGGLYSATQAKNEPAVITLAAGGTSVVGKVNCTYR
jgi:hypothetical protein